MTLIVALGVYCVARILRSPQEVVETPSEQPPQAVERLVWSTPTVQPAATPPVTPSPAAAAAPMQIPPGLLPIVKQIAEAMMKNQASNPPSPSAASEVEEPAPARDVKLFTPMESPVDPDALRKFDYTVLEILTDGAVCSGAYYGLKPSETIHPEKLDPRDKNRQDIGMFFVQGMTGVFENEHRTGWMERAGTRRLVHLDVRNRLIPAFREVQEPPEPVHKPGYWMRWSGRTMFDQPTKSRR